MPRAAALAAALSVALLLAAPHGAAAAQTVGLEVLILTTPAFVPSVDFITAVLQGLGVRHTVVAIDAAAALPLDMHALLTAPDGSARYAGWVMYPNLEAIGSLTRAQVLALWEAQKATGARSVKFGAWPTNVGFMPDLAACGSSDAPLAFTEAMPLGISGIRRGAPLTSGGLYRCPGHKAQPLSSCSIWANDFGLDGIQAPCSAVSVLDFVPQPPTPGDGSSLGQLQQPAEDTAAALLSYADGRESLAFMIDCASWSPSCLVLGHAALSWLLRDIIPGQRQALLSVQVDDFFLSTYFDSQAPGPGGKTQYRATLADVQAHASWQSELTARLPAGSDVRLDLPFNGNGVVVAAASGSNGMVPLVVDDRSCQRMPEYTQYNCACWLTGSAACPRTQERWCWNCTKDWAKPVGSGTNRVPLCALSAPQTWSLPEIKQRDPLAGALADNLGRLADAFHWSHHTFTHQNLDNATFYDADIQMKLNAELADLLGLSSRMSHRAMVTPQISGLRNGDALAALAKHGVTCAAGDNTWPHLLNAEQPYHMLYSTAESSGYDGFAILPRFATDIYYNCSNEALYSTMTASYYGGPSTIDQIVAREAERVLREGLLRLKADPYMMHQANLALLDGSGKSLLMRWVDAVVDEYTKLVTWPLRSLSLDDIFAAFKAREARDRCDLRYALEFEPGGAATAVVVSSGAAAAPADGAPVACDAPLMLSASAAGGAALDGSSSGGSSGGGLQAAVTADGVVTLHITVFEGDSVRVPLPAGATWAA